MLQALLGALLEFNQQKLSSIVEGNYSPSSDKTDCALLCWFICIMHPPRFIHHACFCHSCRRKADLERIREPGPFGTIRFAHVRVSLQRRVV